MRYIIAVIALLLSSDGHAQMRNIDAVSNIENVTVFSSGARIERIATVALPAGKTQVSFRALSSQLDPQSIQLAANENITLLSVQAAKDFMSERKLSENEKLFIRSIDSLASRIAMEKKMLEVYRNEENMLVKNEAIGGQAGVKSSELKDALNLHRQRLTEVYKKQLEIENAIRQTERELETFQKQLNEFGKKKDSVDYVVTAQVEVKSSGNVIFQLFYNVKDAGWYPSYDVRIKSISAPLAFLMNANIFQRSGESWRNVSVSLSTGSPNENTTPTELQPWKISFDNPLATTPGRLTNVAMSGRVTDADGEPIAAASVSVKGTAFGTITDANGFFKIVNAGGGSGIIVSAIGFESRELPVSGGYINIVLKQSESRLEEVVATSLSGRAAGVTVKMRGAQSLDQNKKGIQTVDVTTHYQPTTLVYKIDGKYTIETDGKTTAVGMKSFDVNAVYQHFSIPKIDLSSYLTALVADWYEYDLQPGEASIYFEGSFLGKTYIDLSEVGDTLSLSLGKDNGVKVSRKNIKEYTSRRFIGSNKTESRQYEIQVRNSKKQPVAIIIQDQFPVSTTKEISVSDMKAPGAKVDDETGIVTWDLKLAPGEEKKLTISYTVKYPKDRKLFLE